MDTQVLGYGDLLMPGLDLLLHPAVELVLEERGTYVCQPLLRHLGQLEARLR